MAFIISSLLKGVLLPALVSGFILLFLKRPLGSIATTIAIGVGFLAGYLGIQQYVYPPKSLLQWLPHVAIAALVLGILERFYRHIPWLVWLLRLALAELFLWQLFIQRLTHPSPRVRWSGGEAFINFFVPTLVILASFWLWDRVLKQEAAQNYKRLHALYP
ncbi:MAG: hypothetical protein R2880_06325 [Deinococcales bacterium]